MERGVLLEFLACKLALVLFALALLGAILGMTAGFSRTSEQAELRAVVDEVARAIWVADELPLELELRHELPSISQDFKLLLTGTWDGHQTVLISAGNRAQELELTSRVNGGDFKLEVRNPRLLTLVKAKEIELRLS